MPQAFPRSINIVENFEEEDLDLLPSDDHISSVGASTVLYPPIKADDGSLLVMSNADALLFII